MDEASLAALHLSVEAALRAAGVELRRLQDELTSTTGSLARAREALRAVQARRARWTDDLGDLSGHSLSVAELQDLRRGGRALEEREAEGVRRVGGLGRAMAELAGRVEAQRRVVAEHLARQRWIESQAVRRRAGQERRTASREDED